MTEYILYIVAFAAGLGAAYLFFKTQLKKWASALTLLSTKQNNVGGPSRGNEAETKLPSEFDSVVKQYGCF
jgi:hypothetical protein